LRSRSYANGRSNAAELDDANGINDPTKFSLSAVQRTNLLGGNRSVDFDGTE